MKKPKYDVEKAIIDLPMDPPGFAHGLNLLLLAIGKTNPAIGTLLDEFTSMHAEYLAELQAQAPASIEHMQVVKLFTESTKLIYKRLRRLEAGQSAMLRTQQEGLATLMRIH